MSCTTTFTPLVREPVLPPIEIATGTEVSNVNQNIMRRLERALAKDPETDLLSMFPPSYPSRFIADSAPSSAIAMLNRQTVKELEFMTSRDPEIDLLNNFPVYYKRNYALKKRLALPAGEPQTAVPEPVESQKPKSETLTRLDSITTASILSPLSDTVTTLLAENTTFSADSKQNAQSLATSLKQTFRNSQKLWEFPVRGVVLKCSDQIVAKVIMGFRDSTEYTSMQYLAEHAPDIPAPRPHGLIDLHPFTVIFMSYIPSMTLTKAWPTLTHENKVSVQHQLDDIFGRLRKLKQPDGFALGGVGGERVKDLHREEYRSDKVINTGAGFDDFKFSLPHYGHENYVKFLRGFLPAAVQESVFTHGDLRTENIMVEIDQNSDCVVTGIIDWEDSGFYPDHHESTKLTNTLNTRECDDWYLYLPTCIAPSTFAVKWLVDCIWDRHIKCLISR